MGLMQPWKPWWDFLVGTLKALFVEESGPVFHSGGGIDPVFQDSIVALSRKTIGLHGGCDFLLFPVFLKWGASPIWP